MHTCIYTHLPYSHSHTYRGSFGAHTPKYTHLPYLLTHTHIHIHTGIALVTHDVDLANALFDVPPALLLVYTHPNTHIYPTYTHTHTFL